ncbi:hypothetical protein [Rubritalea halochordaticola]|uniref:hypothetical protein n=1 Tax=Rubritalea halochordaticola TaxID=714537 RepID=UPI0031FD8D2A
MAAAFGEAVKAAVGEPAEEGYENDERPKQFAEERAVVGPNITDEVAGDQQERAADTAGTEDGAGVSGGDAFKDGIEEGHEVAC